MKRFFCALALVLFAAGCGGEPEVSSDEPLVRMAGQMVMCGFRGTGDDPGADSIRPLLEDIEQGRVGGVIYFDIDNRTGDRVRNIVSLEQTERLSALLQSKADIPLFIGIDQEGGRVRRLKPEHGAPDFPSARVLGAGSPEESYRQGEIMGRMLASVGVNVDFAPCLDVDVNPESPAIGLVERSFSADPEVVAAHGEAFARGLSGAGVLPVYKHFPGHGSALHDTHLGMADITSTWREAELLPYKRILQHTPPAMMMIGHIVHRDKTGDLPASLSPTAVQGLLREELGWDGVVVTDDLQMKAICDAYSLKETVRRVVDSGGDILLFGNNLEYDPELGRKIHAALLELVREGAVSRERITESWQRIMRLKREMGLINDVPALED